MSEGKISGFTACHQRICWRRHGNNSRRISNSRTGHGRRWWQRLADTHLPTGSHVSLRLGRSDANHTPCTNRVVITAVEFTGVKVYIHGKVITFLDIKLLQTVGTPHREEATTGVWLIIGFKQEVLRHPRATIVLTGAWLECPDYFSLNSWHICILISSLGI